MPTPISGWELAQLNIARMRTPLDHPAMADFVGALDRINALADGADGFRWRLQTEAGDATAVRPWGDDTILVNLSVWRDAAALQAYVYRSDHAEVMRRRREWFDRMAEAFLVLWWVPAGHRPSVEEAVARLEQLRALGPSPAAFSFRALFPAPDQPATGPVDARTECPAG